MSAELQRSGVFPNGDTWEWTEADFFSVSVLDDDGNAVIDSEGDPVLEYPYMDKGVVMFRIIRRRDGRAIGFSAPATLQMLRDNWDATLEFLREGAEHSFGISQA